MRSRCADGITHVRDASVGNIRDEAKEEEKVRLVVGQRLVDLVHFDFSMLDTGLVLPHSGNH